MSVVASGLGQAFLSGSEFAAFRIGHQLDIDEIACWLGLTEDEVRDMEKRGAPKVAALALSAIDRGLSPWTPLVLP